MKQLSGGMSRYWRDRVKEFRRIKIIYLFAFIIVAHVIIFAYVPMYGIIIAFRRYKIGISMFEGEWVGLRYFIQFFSGGNAWKLIRNTLYIGGYSLLFGFPAPILLALMFNEIKNKRFKKISQTISYMPNFISLVIVIGIIRSFFMSTGLFNDIRVFMGLDRINIFADPRYFRTLYVASGIWQGVGMGTIIYLAAISGVDTELYEAASIDGANRLQRITHIVIPSIMPVITMMLILSAGSVISVGFDKAFLMQTPTNLDVSEMISTYVYKTGIRDQNYSFGTAVGLFTGVVSMTLLVITNALSKRISETSLW